MRGLVIDMVLATDMSSHFDQLKQMRLLLSSPERYGKEIYASHNSISSCHYVANLATIPLILMCGCSCQ